MKCRHCKNKLNYTFLDLGKAPASNAYLEKEELSKPELYFPLKVKVCEECWLVQTEDYANADKLFDSKYAYFSSISKSFLNHAKEYSNKMIRKFNLNSSSYVIEVASNDGYLLKNFVKNKIPCLGIEPTDSTAVEAEKQNIPVIRKFFGLKLAKDLARNNQKADLIIGNNVYAHVPDINDFTFGMKEALKENGVITLEFPELLNTIKGGQFDQIYHEHFSYLSLTAVMNIFSKCGLRVWDVEKLPTHGGSLRVYGCHVNSNFHKTSLRVKKHLQNEKEFGLLNIETYLNFQSKANDIKNKFYSFLLEQKNNGKRVIAYGAAAKGNTLLNYCKVNTDLIEFVCDGAPSKQGMFLPGSHIPIYHPSVLKNSFFDYVVIFPWNIKSEIINEIAFLKDHGTKFVIAVPELEII